MKILCICKRCGELAEVDTSGVLTSLPPQYAYDCSYCGNIGCVTERELIYDTTTDTAPVPAPVCDITAYTVTTDISTFSALGEQLAIPCLICGESVPAKNMHGYEAGICEKCKKAVLKMREALNNE